MHLSRSALDAGLDHIRRSPRDAGRVGLIVARPAVDRREVLEEAVLDATEGLAGDSWLARGSITPGGQALPEGQITLMNDRVARLVAVDEDRRALAGDQLYVDLDLSVENLPPGTHLAVGSAVLRVSLKPHLGCWKFEGRFGSAALAFVNSSAGRALRLRGVNAEVVVGGTVRTGDLIYKADPNPLTESRLSMTITGNCSTEVT